MQSYRNRINLYTISNGKRKVEQIKPDPAIEPSYKKNESIRNTTTIIATSSSELSEHVKPTNPMFAYNSVIFMNYYIDINKTYK